MPRGGVRPGAGRKPKAEQTQPVPRPVGRPTLYRPEYCDLVIADMGKGYSLTAFAGLIGVNRDTIHRWMQEHPEFSEAVTRGKALRLRDWETVALEMRTKGGGPGGATMTVFGLKNMGGDEWFDTHKVDAMVNAKVEHSADDGFRDVILALESAGRAKAALALGAGEVDSICQAEPTPTSE